MGKQQSSWEKTKAQISFAVTAKLINVFIFATRIVQLLFFLNPKFPVSNSFCDCTAGFVSDLVEPQIVGFLTHRLILFREVYTFILKPRSHGQICSRMFVAEKYGRVNTILWRSFFVKYL